MMRALLLVAVVALAHAFNGFGGGFGGGNFGGGAVNRDGALDFGGGALNGAMNFGRGNINNALDFGGGPVNNAQIDFGGGVIGGGPLNQPWCIPIPFMNNCGGGGGSGGVHLPSFDFKSALDLFMLLGQAGLDLGSLVLPGGRLSFGGIPGFTTNGHLDLGALGITLPDLASLGLDFGAALNGLNLDLGALPGFDLSLGQLNLGSFAFPGMNLGNINWGGLFGANGKLNLPALRLPSGALNLDFLSSLGFPALSLPSITLPLLPPFPQLPTFDLGFGLKFLGFLSEIGLDLGNLVVGGRLNLMNVPGFNWHTGQLDLTRLGFTLPDLAKLRLTWPGLLDGPYLDLPRLPGFDLASGSLDLGALSLPGLLLPNMDWSGLFLGGRLNLGQLLLPNGGLNLDFLGRLGFPTLNLGGITLPKFDFDWINLIPCLPIPFIRICNNGGGQPCIPIPFVNNCPATSKPTHPATAAPTTTPAAPTTTRLLTIPELHLKECKIPLDIGILLDSSKSIGQKAWDNVPVFVRNFANSLNLETAQLGVYEFSHKARPNWLLTNDMAVIERGLQNRRMTHLWGGTTRTDLGLDLVKKDFKTRGRAGVHKIVFVLTDGDPYPPNLAPLSKVKQSAEELQAISDVIAVGIGTGVKHSVLEMIAGNPKNVYEVANYDDLVKKKDAIIKGLCPAGSIISG